mmetsp:Transcript_66778/g.145674  ORF Transcript_66778/g.145674 Transcript_66778/m.145674 type:complete len:326 (-) Transcript_66778:228-1205(-)
MVASSMASNEKSEPSPRDLLLTLRAQLGEAGARPIDLFGRRKSGALYAVPGDFRKSLAVVGFRPSDEEFNVLFSQLDVHGRGSLRPQELDMSLQLAERPTPESRLRSPRKSTPRLEVRSRARGLKERYSGDGTLDSLLGALTQQKAALRKEQEREALARNRDRRTRGLREAASRRSEAKRSHWRPSPASPRVFSPVEPLMSPYLDSAQVVAATRPDRGCASCPPPFLEASTIPRLFEERAKDTLRSGREPNLPLTPRRPMTARPRSPRSIPRLTPEPGQQRERELLPWKCCDKVPRSLNGFGPSMSGVDRDMYLRAAWVEASQCR